MKILVLGSADSQSLERALNRMFPGEQIDFVFQPGQAVVQHLFVSWLRQHVPDWIVLPDGRVPELYMLRIIAEYDASGKHIGLICNDGGRALIGIPEVQMYTT